MLYPIFVLHFAALINRLPALVLGDRQRGIQYLKGSVGVLAGPDLSLLFTRTLASGFRLVLFERGAECFLASDTAFADDPDLWKNESQSFALARFCATYEMQLDSGVNVMDSLTAASKTSQSALVRDVVDKTVPLVRGGAQVGPLLAGSDAFTQGHGALDPDRRRDRQSRRRTQADGACLPAFQAEGMSQLDLLGAVFCKGDLFRGDHGVRGWYLVIKQYTAAISIARSTK